MSLAQSKVKEENKKLRNSKTILNKENILELLLDLNQNFPLRILIFLDQFTLDRNVVSFIRVNEFQDIGAVQSSPWKIPKV